MKPGGKLTAEERLTIAADRVFDALRGIRKSPYGISDRALVLAALSRLDEYDDALAIIERTARELGITHKTLGQLAVARVVREKGLRAGRPRHDLTSAPPTAAP